LARWEVFNLFNKANFGRIFSAKDAREMQFGVKLNF